MGLVKVQNLLKTNFQHDNWRDMDWLKKKIHNVLNKNFGLTNTKINYKMHGREKKVKIGQVSAMDFVFKLASISAVDMNCIPLIKINFGTQLSTIFFKNL